MGCITRNILRWGIIGGLALGGVTLLLGPQRVAMGLSHLRSKAQVVVDSCVNTDDPMALRRQLEHLADEYPDRIAEVQGKIAEVDHQLAQLERDVEVSGRVVAMTTEDLLELKTLVARAEAELGSSSRAVAIRFGGVRFDVEEAYTEGRRINSVRSTYQDRLAADEVQVNFLTEQKARLHEILGTLEEEFASYQAQLWQLDRQIDAIERNEWLIELVEKQQETLDSFERFGEVQNIRQLESKLAELMRIQEAQLAQLEKQGVHRDYEKAAAYELETGNPLIDPFETIIEIQLEGDTTDDAETTEDDSLVWNGPTIIE